MAETSYTVLVVDDSATNRAYLSYILEEDGYRTVQAPSGEDCIDKARAELPVVILLDVVMGGIDGFETLARLKADRRTARIPVLMLTSLDDELSKLKAFELGAVDYITKSSRAAEVRARVRVHVRLSMANGELLASRAESLMQIARAQRSMFARPEDWPEAAFSVYYRSLQEAGGDFYDVVPVSEAVHLYFIADVAGHDVGTSYVTPAVKVLLKQFATPAYSLEETIGAINGILAATVCADTYLTAFSLRLNRKAMRAIYLGAGHPPAVYLPLNGPAQLLESENPFIGMIEEQDYRSATIDVNRGDRFILFTDGLLEGRVGAGAWIDSKDEIIPIVESLRDTPLSALPAAIVREFGAEEATDDVALLCVEV
jgi:sigma-B regulation protein RsbU (phosphoserine phosphatase)